MPVVDLYGGVETINPLNTLMYMPTPKTSVTWPGLLWLLQSDYSEDINISEAFSFAGN